MHWPDSASACSCSFQTNVNIIIPFIHQIHCVVEDSDNIQDDMRLPTLVEIGEGSMCFNVTAIDDDLLEGYEPVYILLYNPDNDNYNFCPDKSALSVWIADNDGIYDYLT